MGRSLVFHLSTIAYDINLADYFVTSRSIRITQRLLGPGRRMQEGPISWKNIRSQPRLSHLKLRPYPPIFGMKTVSIPKDSSLIFGVKVQHSTLIMMIVFWESTVLTSGPMIGFLDREKTLSEPSVPYVNLSDRS